MTTWLCSKDERLCPILSFVIPKRTWSARARASVRAVVGLRFQRLPLDLDALTLEFDNGARFGLHVLSLQRVSDDDLSELVAEIIELDPVSPPPLT